MPDYTFEYCPCHRELVTTVNSHGTTVPSNRITATSGHQRIFGSRLAILTDYQQTQPSNREYDNSPAVVSHGDTAMVVTFNAWDSGGTQSLPRVITEMLDHHRDTAPPYRQQCDSVGTVTKVNRLCANHFGHGASVSLCGTTVERRHKVKQAHEA
jgi:hypothetical protein